MPWARKPLWNPIGVTGDISTYVFCNGREINMPLDNFYFSAVLMGTLSYDC